MPQSPRERGQSAKTLLKVDWQYPTYAVEERHAEGATFAPKHRVALAQPEAFRVVAGDDPRPLLVLRECQVCNGTDDALLTKGTDNERTFLLSTWFHCVKLPIDVLQPDHPFYELFGHEDPEHLFVALPDGSLKFALESDTSRTELWDDMGQVLAASYKKDPQASVKQVQKSLDRLDVLDARMLDLKAKQNELLETEGASSGKLRKLDGELSQVKQEIAATLEEVAKARKLELKRGDAAKAGTTPAKAGR